MMNPLSKTWIFSANPELKSSSFSHYYEHSSWRQSNLSYWLMGELRPSSSSTVPTMADENHLQYIPAWCSNYQKVSVSGQIKTFDAPYQ